VLIAINLVLLLRGAMYLVVAVRFLRHQFHRKLFREKDLSGVRSVPRLIRSLRFTASQSDFEMNVIRPAHVISGKDRLECYRAV
jgi:hypothetical protein